MSLLQRLAPTKTAATLLLLGLGVCATGCSAAPGESSGTDESALTPGQTVVYSLGACVSTDPIFLFCRQPEVLKQLVALGCQADRRYFEFDPYLIGVAPT